MISIRCDCARHLANEFREKSIFGNISTETAANCEWNIVVWTNFRLPFARSDAHSMSTFSSPSRRRRRRRRVCRLVMFNVCTEQKKIENKINKQANSELISRITQLKCFDILMQFYTSTRHLSALYCYNIWRVAHPPAHAIPSHIFAVLYLYAHRIKLLFAFMFRLVFCLHKNKIHKYWLSAWRSESESLVWRGTEPTAWIRLNVEYSPWV